MDEKADAAWNMREPVAAIREDYILVALDASPHSAACPGGGGGTGGVLHLELRGILSDVNLLRLCGLPFGLEIGSVHSSRDAHARRTHIGREFRMQAALLRKIMADGEKYGSAVSVGHFRWCAAP